MHFGNKIPENSPPSIGQACTNLINDCSVTKKIMDKLLFPHDKVRPIQVDLLKSVQEAIENRSHLIAHAPTGLGKTAATIAPALSHAIENNLTVFFLTSRHTQHKIVVDTLKQVKEKYNTEFGAADIVGKRWMCPVPNVDKLNSSEFGDYCKSQRENNKCEFFTNTRKGNKLEVRACRAIEKLQRESPVDVEAVVDESYAEKLCPYEVSIELAKKARVVIGDYYYIFSESIKNNFFNRANKKMEDSIIIIDEGHNLPGRLRELKTGKLSSFIMSRAIKEAKKHGYDETIGHLQGINDALNSLASPQEKLVRKEDFIDLIPGDYYEVIADLEFIGETIRSNQKKSFIGSVADFLEKWDGYDEGFARIINTGESAYGPVTTLTYRCLDPSLVSRDIIQKSYSTILMSGTLNPTSMYRDVLGFPENTKEASFRNPFPQKNRLAMVVPQTTTKFTERNEAQFREIARICADIVNEVPGNSAIFFPSYQLRDKIDSYFNVKCRKTTFLENPMMTKQEKAEMLERFKGYNGSGAVLLGAAAGSFGEGIDLPGNLLKCVVIVGLPLQKPDLETQKLISYYDLKFGKGWDYGYLFPAFNKSLQNAGRCIRSNKDKGVILFLDQRYAWPNYARCFPESVTTTSMYMKRIKEFFTYS